MPELEKRVKATVLVAAKRTIESKWVKQHRSYTRPNSRTLTTVYDGLLEDLVSPSVILGRRIRVRVDGTKFYRMYCLFVILDSWMRMIRKTLNQDLIQLKLFINC